MTKRGREQGEPETVVIWPCLASFLVRSRAQHPRSGTPFIPANQLGPEFAAVTGIGIDLGCGTFLPCGWGPAS